MASYLPVAPSIPFSTSSINNTVQAPDNLLEQKVRVINATNYKNNFQSLSYGDTTLLHLPMNKLLSSTVLTFKLPANKLADGNHDPTGIPQNCYIPDAWAHHLVEWIEYTFDSSTTLRLTGEQMLIHNLGDCSSGVKRTEYLAAAGVALDSYGAMDVQTSGSTIDLVGSIVVPLPFSSISEKKIMPFDSSVLGSSPIQLRVKLRDALDFFSFPAGNAAQVSTQVAAQGSKLREAYMQVKTSYFVDGPSMSVAPLTGMGGGYLMDYAFLYNSRYPSWNEQFLGQSSKNAPITRRLDGVPAGSLQSVDVYVRRVSLNSAVTDGAYNSLYRNNTKSTPWEYVPIRNVKLNYAGQEVYSSDDDTNIMFSLCEYESSPSFAISVPKYDEAAAAPDAPVDSRKGYWCRIQFSQFNTQIMDCIQTGVMLNSNLLSISFNTPELVDLADSTGAVPVSQPLYQMYAHFNVQASVRVADGSSQILYMPTTSLLPSVATPAGRQ